MDMQSKEPAMQSNFKKKHGPLCKDKNSQSTRCYRKKSSGGTMYGNDKNCQEISNVQNVNMWPKKPISHMQSVTKTIVMQLSNPAVKQSTYKWHQGGRNCQSNRCFKKKCPLRPVYNGKNCQSANF